MILATISLLLGALLGGIFAIIGLRDIFNRSNSGSLIPTSATVLSSGIDESQALDGGVPTYTPWLIYEYGHMGQRYRSPKTSLTTSAYFDSMDANKYLNQWKTGTKRSAWVNDKFPHNSTLNRYSRIEGFASAFFGIAMICFSLYMLSR